MAEATKSVLLLDYDSIHRSVSASDAAAGGRLATRLASWMGAIEAGSVFAAAESAGRRRVLIRRCYADPTLLGNDRAAFLSNGFQVVDCPPAEGREHNAAAIHMVLDAIDALDHPTGYEEFILLSADSDLTALLIRLRAHNRTTAIYTRAVTAESYKAIADAMVEESRFVAALLSEEEPAEEEQDERQTRPPAERSEIEALARKVSSATNVPLLAPRTFAELFRHLCEEIAQNGYHFQTTAENVATRMADAGRNVSRRQVVFVVKGLALKGHVFSTGDTPERLADVFREQVLYLTDNAGLALDDDERRVLPSWIVGKIPAGAARNGDIRKAAARATGDDDGEAPKTDNGQAGRAPRRRPIRPAVAPSKPREEPKPTEAEPPKAALAARPAPAPRPTEETKIAVPRQEAAATRPEATPAASRPAAASAAPPPATAGPTTVAKEKPAAPTGAVTGTPAPASRPTPVAKPAARSAESDEDADADAVESSILAAIAQAVDVLVEDSGGKPAAQTQPDDVGPGPSDKAEKKVPPVKPEDEEAPEGDDIGDEIQRIIATYSRNRNKDNNNKQ